MLWTRVIWSIIWLGDNVGFQQYAAWHFSACVSTIFCAFSALTLLVGRQEGHPACKKLEWWFAGVVICLERGADLHMPSWCHCHSLSLAPVKSRLVLPFWYRLTRVVPDKRPLNRCVCVVDINVRRVTVTKENIYGKLEQRFKSWMAIPATKTTVSNYWSSLSIVFFFIKQKIWGQLSQYLSLEGWYWPARARNPTKRTH